MSIAMKQRIFFIVLLFLFLSWPISKPRAACVIGSAKKVQVNITFQSQGDSGSTLTIPGKFKSFHRNKPQCTSPNESSPTVVSCDEETESLAADSLFAPLCGASEEREKANSTCWDCGGSIKCDGMDTAVGETSNIFNTHERCPFDKDNPNWSGDVFCATPDETVKKDKKFTYNGIQYDFNGELIVACGSNNLACGASEECRNLAHNEISNRGKSDKQQCKAYSFTSKSFQSSPFTLPFSSKSSSSSPKACINVGDRIAELDNGNVYDALGNNGWVYISAHPEWMGILADRISKKPSYSYMIRLHYPGRPLTPDLAIQWAEEINTYAMKLKNAGAKQIVLMPVNEPNNIAPDRHVSVENTTYFVSALVQELDRYGLRDSVVTVASPMWDLSSADLYGYIDQLGGKNYLNQFSMLSFASYGHYGDGNGANFSGLSLQNGKISEFLNHYQLQGKSIIIPEFGTDIGGTIQYQPAAGAIVDYLTQTKQEWQSAMATCIFSYNPDTNGDQGWLYDGSTQGTHVLSALKGLSPSSTPLPIISQPKPQIITSYQSYESCTEAGVPKIPSKTRIPNLVSPSRQNSNSKLYTVTGVTFPVPRKKIKGMISLADNILKYPVMSTFATMLDNALPAFLSLATQQERQIIVHPLTITADTKVCVESEDGEVRARPIKNDIKTEYKDLNKLVGATPYFASILGLKKLTKYEQNNMAKLHPDLAPGGGFDDCPDPPKALSVREMAGLSGGAEFEVVEEKSPIYRTASRWIPQGVLDNISKLLCLVGGSADCNTDFDPKYFLNIDLINPYMTQSNDLIGVDNQTGKHTGFVNSFAPGVLQKFLGNDPGKIPHKVNQSLGSNFEPVNIDLNTVNAQGIQTHERFLRCAITPQSKQFGDTCTFTDIRIPNTSDWAIDGGSAISSGFSPQTGSIQEAIAQAAASEQIPQCALEAVGYIEGAYNWKENDSRQQSCPRNICSAAGPFQITTGVDGNGEASCSACDSSWVKKNGCPNTWGNRPGDPCSNYEYAAQISAQILKGKVAYGSEGALSLTNADPKTQKDAIILAGNGYYGGDAPVGRLGGCSYGEFVYKRCDPSYTCAQQTNQ